MLEVSKSTGKGHLSHFEKMQETKETYSLHSERLKDV